MNAWLGYIVLALLWASLTGSFSPANLALGLFIGVMTLFLLREQIGSLSYVKRPGRVALLAGLFIYELILSAWRVAVLVLSPRMDLKPGILAYTLTVRTDFQITLLANLITLTPGTLSVAVSEDRRVLFIHALDCSDPDQARRDIEQGFERRILEAFG